MKSDSMKLYSNADLQENPQKFPTMETHYKKCCKIGYRLCKSAVFFFSPKTQFKKRKEWKLQLLVCSSNFYKIIGVWKLTHWGNTLLVASQKTSHRLQGKTMHEYRLYTQNLREIKNNDQGCLYLIIESR